MELKNIEDLLPPFWTSKQFIGTKVSNLTAAGDNYGSLMLSADITFKNNEGQTELFRTVAKTLPQNEFVQVAFNSQRTFKNEIGFYKTIAPCLKKFQEEQGLQEVFNSFPEFVGARFSLDPESDKIDQDCVLLIKNIQDEGFSNVDRTVGFDLDQTKLILEKLAELQGTFMALKTIKPEIFKKELGCYFEPFKIFDFGDTAASNSLIENVIDQIKDDEYCKMHLKKIREICEATCHAGCSKNDNNDQNGSFLSIVHSDMWCNNIMVKIIDNKTTDVKFIDFQLYEYSSLSRDVIFFLFTSVKLEVIQGNIDYFLNFYYKNLIKWLNKLKYDTSRLTYEAFIEDVKTVLKKAEFFHILMMLAPIYASKEDAQEVEDVNVADMVEQRKKVSDKCKQKSYFIVHEVIERGWI